jgi:hypothetical protein
VREARSIVYPHRHARRGQRIDATRASARRRLVGDHPNINAALFGPDQRPNDPGTDRQAVAATRISRSAVSMALTANAAQSSSGAKQTAIAASVEAEAADCEGEIAPSASVRANRNTHYGYSFP